MRSLDKLRKYADDISQVYGVLNTEDSHLHLLKHYNKKWSEVWSTANRVYEDYFKIGPNEFSISKKERRSQPGKCRYLNFHEG